MLKWFGDHWEWGVAFSVCSIVGAIVRWWITRPKLDVEFDSCELASRKVLGCVVTNLPLNWLKRDTALGVTGRLTIEERHTNRVVHSEPVEFEGSGFLGGPVRKIDIPPGDDGESIAIIDIFCNSGTVSLHWGSMRIDPGEYDVYIWLQDGGRQCRFVKGLRVTENDPWACWADL